MAKSCWPVEKYSAIWGTKVAGRHQPVDIDEPVRVGALGRLDQEDRHVHSDEQVIDDRRGTRRDVVTKRNHTP